jgi:hypothetical protein
MGDTGKRKRWSGVSVACGSVFRWEEKGAVASRGFLSLFKGKR